jgi:hypothetical protein
MAALFIYLILFVGELDLKQIIRLPDVQIINDLFHGNQEINNAKKWSQVNSDYK